MTGYQVKFGDVWAVGSHRLLCGDSTEPAMMNAFLVDRQPALCVTDPPYGIGYSSKAGSDALHELRVRNDHYACWTEAFRTSGAPVLYVWFSFLCFDIVKRSEITTCPDFSAGMIFSFVCCAREAS